MEASNAEYTMSRDGISGARVFDGEDQGNSCPPYPWARTWQQSPNATNVIEGLDCVITERKRIEKATAEIRRTVTSSLITFPSLGCMTSRRYS